MSKNYQAERQKSDMAPDHEVKANLAYKTRTIEIIYIILLQNFF